MPGKEHHYITEKAISLLPERQRLMIAAELENLVEDYCTYPDRYMDVCGDGHEIAKPYYYESEGIQFHYVPDTPVAPYYRYYRPAPDGGGLVLPEPPPNRNWLHVSRGFAFYLERGVAALRDGRLRDGCAFLGCLLHFLQDYGYGLHSLEGPDGTDCFVLDRLFPETEDASKLPSSILGSGMPEFDARGVEGYRPRLLGSSIPEVVFHLYSRHAAVTRRARRICHSIVVAVIYGVAAVDVSALVNELSRNIVKLCSDVLCTALSLASGERDGCEPVADAVYLSDMEPITRPWGTRHYGFLSFLRDKALDSAGRAAPLSLLFRENGEALARTYSKGFGVGEHVDVRLSFDIPAGVYRSFSCDLGLFPGSVSSGRGGIRAMLTLGGEVVLERVFTADEPASRVELRDPGGVLELRMESDLCSGPGGHFVIGDPLLAR